MELKQKEMKNTDYYSEQQLQEAIDGSSKGDSVIRIGNASSTQTDPTYPKAFGTGNSSPFGWVRFIDEGEVLRIIEHSENMPSHLGIIPEEGEIYSIVGKNLLQFLPWSETEKFTSGVRSVEISSAPVAIRHHYLHINNTCPEVFSCIRKERSENGGAIYTSVYEDISYRALSTDSRERQPNLYNAGSPQLARVLIRTFGYFDIFADGQAVPFRNKKAKELLAILVDRRGGYVSSSEAINLLWENVPEDCSSLGRLRKTAMHLRNTLEEYGIADIIESKNRMRRLNPTKVKCDLYDYLDDPAKNAWLFSEHYMENYSWGEMTLAFLSRMKRQ